MPRKRRLTITRDDRHGLYYVFLAGENPPVAVARTQTEKARNGAAVLIDWSHEGDILGIEIIL